MSLRQTVHILDAKYELPTAAVSRGELTLHATKDRRQWESHEHDPGATVYHSWRWLSWIAPLLNCRFVPLLVRRDGISIGIAPLLLRRYGAVYTANVVPFSYLGPVVPAELLSETSAAVVRWGLRHRVVSCELSTYPTADASEQSLATAGLDEESGDTYFVDLRDRPVAKVFESFSSDARSAIRRSAKRGVSVRPSTADDFRQVLPAVHQQALGEPKDYAERLGHSLADSGLPVPARCATAEVEGRPVGMMITLGGTYAQGWLGAVFREHQSTQANSALVWDAVQWASDQGCAWLDMGGAPDPGIASYKSKFKPRAAHHLMGVYKAPGFATAERLHDRVLTWQHARRAC